MTRYKLPPQLGGGEADYVGSLATVFSSNVTVHVEGVGAVNLPRKSLVAVPDPPKDHPPETLVKGNNGSLWLRTNIRWVRLNMVAGGKADYNIVELSKDYGPLKLMKEVE